MSTTDQQEQLSVDQDINMDAATTSTAQGSGIPTQINTNKRPPERTTEEAKRHKPSSVIADPDLANSKKEKDTVMLFTLISMFVGLIYYIKMPVADIAASCDAASMFRNCHKYLKGSKGETPEEDEIKKGYGEAIKYKLKGKEITINTREYCQHIVMIAGHFGLSYKVDNKSKGNWFAVAAPIIAYLSTFKNSVEELRLGTIAFKKGVDKAGKEIYEKITDYGFLPQHSILAQKVTYPPELRTSILKSCGPVTQIIGLLKNPANPYREKFENVLNETFKFINGISSLWPILAKKQNTAEARSICSSLGNIVLQTTARNHFKASPPLAIMYDLIPKVYIDHYLTKVVGNRPIPLDLGHIPLFDFSGYGLFHYWNHVSSKMFNFPQMDVSLAQQIIFHGTFGTCGEDLSLLQKITNFTSWNDRRVYGDVFRGMYTKEQTIQTNLISFKYASKLKKALLTKNTPASAQQMVVNPVFGGYRSNPILKALIDMLNDGAGTSLGGMTDIIQLDKAIKKLLNVIITKTEELERFKYGTTKWFKIGGFPFKPEEVEHINDEFDCNNQFFNALDKSLLEVYKKDSDEAKKRKEKRDKALEKD